MASLWGQSGASRGSLFDFEPRQQSPMAGNIGALAAIAQDLGGALSGRPDRVGAAQALAEKERTEQVQRELSAALNSGDPELQQKAYRFAAMNGMDPDKLKAAFEAPQDEYKVAGDRIYRIPAGGGMPTIAASGPKKPNETREINIGNEVRTEEFDPEKGVWNPLGTAPRWQPQRAATGGGGGDGGGAGGFGGKTADERFMNILLKGDPNTPEYAAAYGYVSKPRATINPETGQVVTIKQDVSWARPPMRDGKPYGGPSPSVNIGEQAIVPKQNQEQKIAAGFADRMAQAELDLSVTEEALGDASQVAKGSVPLVGNFLVNDQYQSADQAKRNWINANLRRESGATIQQPEFDNANKQYFIQPGDSDQVKAQKRRNRQTAEAAMRRGSSNKIGEEDGKQKPAPRVVGPQGLPQKSQPATGWTVKRRD